MSGRPAILPVVAEGIPGHFVRGARWVNWRLEPKRDKPGEWTKEPYRADDPTRHASSTDPKSWATFDAAFMAYQNSATLDGVGWNLEGSGVVGLDLDDAIDERGATKPWAQEIMDAFPGYWERSPLGRGLRGLALGTLPPGRRKVKHHGCTVEIYAAGRYLTITGQVIRPVDELPELQDAIEAIHARVFGGAEIDGGGVATTMAGRADTIPPEYLPVLEAVMGGRYAAQIAKVWAGNFSDFKGDESNGEWALMREIAFHAMGLGFAGDALVLVIETLMRAGPYRPKWEHPRAVTQDDGSILRTTWLGLSIGRAIKSRMRKDPELDLEGLDEPATTNETSADTIRRLTRELAQERTVVAAQATIIRSQRATIEQLKELRDRDRRATLALRNLKRSKMFSATQADVIEATARIATSLANTHQTDAPIVTREMVAEDIGCDVNTAGAAMKKVFELEGSPIRRHTRILGPCKKVTEHVLDTRDPIEIIEKMTMIGNGLTERPKRYPNPTRCPVHPDAGTKIVCAEGGCGIVLLERPAPAPPGNDAQYMRVACIEGADPPVVDGTYKMRVASIGDELTDDLADRRAAAAVAIDLRPPDAWKQPGEPTGAGGASLGRIRLTAAPDAGVPQGAPDSPRECPAAWRCACGCMERRELSDGSLRCLKCGAATVAGVAS